MRKQIEEMDLELEQYHRSNSSLNMMIKELKLKIDGILALLILPLILLLILILISFTNSYHKV